MNYYVYILSSDKNGTLYCGITSDLPKRIWEHKSKQEKESFTAKYNVNKLVYLEEYETSYEAIKREKQIKTFQRKWKIELIQKQNPQWNDYFEEMDSKSSLE